MQSNVDDYDYKRLTETSVGQPGLLGFSRLLTSNKRFEIKGDFKTTQKCNVRTQRRTNKNHSTDSLI